MQLKLTKGSLLFKLWHKLPVDIYLKVYIFNVTNEEAFLAGLEKLKVQEIGPYVYRELMEHSDLELNDNGTVSGIPKHPLEFAPELSVGKEDDILVMPNLALVGLASVFAKANFAKKIGFNFLIDATSSKPLINVTVKEFLFDYDSLLVSYAHTYMPHWIDFAKFGIIDRIYNLNGDVFTVYTGETDPHLAGTFATYNRLPYLPKWPSSPCNKLAGASDGSKFQTNIEPNETLWFFRKSITRAIPMVQNGAFLNAAGIEVMRYKFRDDALHYHGEGNEENRCFCLNNTSCLRDGLLDVSQWYYEFPLALSYPHFYMGDPTIGEETEGTSPDAELHETRFEINLRTGIPTKASVKVQANMISGDIRDFKNCERLSNLTIPILWADLNVPEVGFYVTMMLFTLTQILPVAEIVISYMLLIVGGSFFAISIRNFVNLKNEKSLILKGSRNGAKNNQYKHNGPRDSDVKIPLTITEKMG